MSNAQAVVFDLGNVLIGWDPEGFFDSLMPQKDRRRMFQTVDLADMNRRIDLGAPFKETIYETADKHPEFTEIIRLWHDRWIEMAAPAIDHSVALLRALRTKGVPVFALTNFGIESFAVAAAHYPFLVEFDKRYISGHLKVMKPDPRIYDIVEQDCGFAPRELLFTDDRADNIQAARQRGWQGHLFETSMGWADCLVSHNLLNTSEAGLEKPEAS